MKVMRHGVWMTYHEAAQNTGERAEVWGNWAEGFYLMFGGSDDCPHAFARMPGPERFKRRYQAEAYCKEAFGLKAVRGRDW